MVQLTHVNLPDPGPDVLEAARTAFPELSWRHADFPEQGLDHHVAVLSGVSGVPGEDSRLPTVVARLAIAPGVVGRADVEARMLADVDLRAPAAVPRSLATDGNSLTLARHVPGEPLTEAVWAELDDASRTTAAAHLAGTLDALHGRDVNDPEVADVGASWFPVKHSTLTRAVVKNLLPILDRRDADTTRAILTEAETTFIDDPVAPRLIHGDLHETHLRWDDGRLGVIDFSDMTLADPAIDVAHLAGISPDFHARVLSDLDAADRDLERRAAVYSRWDAVFLLIDHLTTGRTPETTARALFGRALESMRGS